MAWVVTDLPDSLTIAREGFTGLIKLNIIHGGIMRQAVIAGKRLVNQAFQGTSQIKKGLKKCYVIVTIIVTG